MKIKPFGIWLGLLLLQLIAPIHALAASNDVKGIDIIIKKKPNGNIHLTTGDTAANARAVATKGISGARTTSGPITATNTETTTISDSPNNVNFTNTDTSTTSSSPSVKNGIVGDGVNLVSNTRLSAAISSNAVVIDPLGAAATPAAAAGNSIAGSAFSGAAGVTVVNMNSGHNSSMQSTVTVTPLPAAR